MSSVLTPDYVETLDDLENGLVRNEGKVRTCWSKYAFITLYFLNFSVFKHINPHDLKEEKDNLLLQY